MKRPFGPKADRGLALVQEGVAPVQGLGGAKTYSWETVGPWVQTPFVRSPEHFFGIFHFRALSQDLLGPEPYIPSQHHAKTSSHVSQLGPSKPHTRPVSEQRFAGASCGKSFWQRYGIKVLLEHQSKQGGHLFNGCQIHLSYSRMLASTYCLLMHEINASISR